MKGRGKDTQSRILIWDESPRKGGNTTWKGAEFFIFSKDPVDSAVFCHSQQMFCHIQQIYLVLFRKSFKGEIVSQGKVLRRGKFRGRGSSRGKCTIGEGVLKRKVLCRLKMLPGGGLCREMCCTWKDPPKGKSAPYGKGSRRRKSFEGEGILEDKVL